MPLLLQQAALQPVALLFGTEMSGLTNEEMGKAQVLVNIPADPDFSSLNLAAAVQVMGYELNVASQSHVPDMPEIDRPRMNRSKAFLRTWKEPCLRSVFSPRRTPRA